MIEELIGSWSSYFKNWKKWHHPTANPVRGVKVLHWSLGGWWQRIKVKFFCANSDDPAWQKILAIFAIDGSSRHEKNEVIEKVLVGEHKTNYNYYKQLLRTAINVSHCFTRDIGEEKYDDSLIDYLSATLKEDYAPQDVLKYEIAVQNILTLKQDKQSESKDPANLKLSWANTLERSKNIIKKELQKQRETAVAKLAQDIFKKFPVFQGEKNSNSIYFYIKSRAEYEVLQEYHALKAPLPVPVFYDALSFQVDDLNSTIPFTKFREIMRDRSNIPFKLYQTEENFPGMPMPTDENIIGAKMRNPLRWLDLVVDLVIGNLARGWFWSVNQVKSGLSFLVNGCFNCCTVPQWLQNCIDTKLVRGLGRVFSFLGDVIDVVIKFPGFAGMIACIFLHFIAKIDNFCCQSEPSLVREAVDAGLNIKATHKQIRHLSSRRHSHDGVQERLSEPKGEQKLESIVPEKKIGTHKSTVRNVRQMLAKDSSPKLIRSNSAAARLESLLEAQVATMTVIKDEKSLPKAIHRKSNYTVAAAPGGDYKMPGPVHLNGFMSKANKGRLGWRSEIQMTTHVPLPSNGLRG